MITIHIGIIGEKVDLNVKYTNPSHLERELADKIELEVRRGFEKYFKGMKEGAIDINGSDTKNHTGTIDLIRKDSDIDSNENLGTGGIFNAKLLPGGKSANATDMITEG